MEPIDKANYDVIVVGAGFGGIRALWELRKQGLSVKSFEAGSDVGGAWYWNSYPGARTDSEAWIYNLNFTPELKTKFNYTERYPSQKEVQNYLSQVVDFYDLRKEIQFNSRVETARFLGDKNVWSITTVDGYSATCRYFVPATGPLSIGREPPFPGLKSFKGEWYLPSNWPKGEVDFRGKRVAVIGTGATGVQIVPKIAPVAKSLTVFQRTANYVLPGRNYNIDENQNEDIKANYDATWQLARSHGSGLPMNASGRTIKDVSDESQIKQILDAGWEDGGFHFHFDTFEDISTNHKSNDFASEYVRNKIRAIVKDQKTAELLCPQYPYLSKRPPCGHFFYEAFNRPNVSLVDISNEEIDLNEKGIFTKSGLEFEFDMIIFAIGFDAATGALTEMDVRGMHDQSLREYWSKRVQTYAGLLVPGFPNMFMVTGPHVPFGNMPVVIEINVSWIGEAISHIKENQNTKVDVSEATADAWSQKLDEAFQSTIFAQSAKANHAWHVGANIPGKPNNILFYFGGVPTWDALLKNEVENGFPNLRFASVTASHSEIEPIEKRCEKASVVTTTA